MTFQKREKKRNNTLIFGIHAIIEGIKSDQNFSKVFLDVKNQNPQKKELIDLLKRHVIPFSQVPAAKLNRITRKAHQGAIAYISPIFFQELSTLIDNCYEKGKLPNIVLLTGVEDTRNLGAIARTALCTGVDALVIPLKGNALISGEAIKSSAGSLLHLPICRIHNISATLSYLAARGLEIIACTEKAKKDLYSSSLKGPKAFLLGNEGKGIPAALLSKAHHQLRIPMLNKLGSLNVSVAGALFLYEKFRQDNRT